MIELNEKSILQVYGGKDADACRNDILTGGGFGATVGGAFGAIGGPLGGAIGAGIGSLAGGALVAHYSSKCK